MAIAARDPMRRLARCCPMTLSLVFLQYPLREGNLRASGAGV
jgi:hypothetical protein